VISSLHVLISSYKNVKRLILHILTYKFTFLLAAFDFVYEQATSGYLERAVGAQSDEIDFLCDVLGNPIFAELVQVSEPKCLLVFFLQLASGLR